MAHCGNIWRTVLFFSYYLFVVFACCPEESLSASREETIRNDFFSSSDVYTAEVKEVNCRCYPHDTTKINCLRLFNDSGLVYSQIPKRYQCDSGFSPYDQGQFQLCDFVSLSVRFAAPVGVDPSLQVLPPFINVTGEELCGLLEPDGDNCQLSFQPCFYNVTVLHVYKGEYKPGDVISTTGPDVFATCGTLDRLLMLTREYVVGIGGVCDPIDEWTPLSSYDDSEVDQLLDLQEQCANNPASCNGSKPSSLMAATLPVVALLSLLSHLLLL